MTPPNATHRDAGATYSRRQFLKLSAATVGTLALTANTGGRARASSGGTRENVPAMLVDLSRCIGCGNCQRSCIEANELKPTVEQTQGLNGENVSVVQTRELEGGQMRYVKRQCMHCLDAACASACPVKALYQTPEGPIAYRPDRCLGCRYCMVSCPFDVPRFEWHDGFTPEIRKCMFCYERQKQGELPACVASCPTAAIRFGTRGDMLSEAHSRLAQPGGHYVDHVYGEHEAGGTAWLYISDVPFDRLGFRTDVTTRPIPAYTWDVMSKLPAVVGSMAVVLTGAALMTRKRAGHLHDHVPPWEREEHHPAPPDETPEPGGRS